MAGSPLPRRAAWPALRALLPAAAAMWISFGALVVLLCSPAMRVYDAAWLPYTAVLQAIADRLATTAWLADGWDSDSTVIATWIYGTIAAAACAAWGWAIRRARTIRVPSAGPIVVLTALVAAPLVVAPGITSDDLYLYNAYGRTIAVHGANPVLVAPAAFPSDPHLEWVHWKELPSSYGPVWLMLSAGVSALAGDSITAALIGYRLAGLALHLIAVALLWRLLAPQRPALALPATLFYAWNPLVLHEVVVNAHNDVLVAVFAIPLVGAAMRGQWVRAAAWAAGAVMAKPFAALLVLPVTRRLWHRRWRPGHARLALAAGVGAAVALALNLPLWSGDALIRNVLGNPAASAYTNSLWEMVSLPDAMAGHRPLVATIRVLAFLGGLAWVLTRRAATRHVALAAVHVWLVFCLTAAWVWPWYFVPALAVAPLAGAAGLRLAAGLTIGGLLFWMAWPYREAGPLALLYQFRSLLLFGPVAIAAWWVPVRGLWRTLPRRHARVGSDAEGVAVKAG